MTDPVPPRSDPDERTMRLAVQIAHPTLAGLDQLAAAVLDGLRQAQAALPDGRVEAVRVCQSRVPTRGEVARDPSAGLPPVAGAVACGSAGLPPDAAGLVTAAFGPTVPPTVPAGWASHLEAATVTAGTALALAPIAGLGLLAAARAVREALPTRVLG